MSSALPAALPAARPGRRALTVLALVAALALLGWQVARLSNAATFPVPIDYAAFWSVGWLTLHGENPYDPARVHEVQQAIGLHHKHAILVYHPPWTLTLLLPLAALPVVAGYGLLCLLELALVVAASDYLWRLFGGRPERRWVGWVVGLGFAPTLFLLGAGQLSGFSLAGLALFLAARRSDRPALAGLAAALIAVKPHLNFLFGLALLLETTRSGFARRAVLAGLFVGLAASAFPLLFNPDIWRLHVGTVTASGSGQHLGLADWKHPLVGSWVRGWVPGQPGWVQAVPCLLAAAAFVPYWWRKADWDWAEELPRMTLVSLLTAVYGAWIFDLVLLLVPVLAAVAAVRWPAPPRRQVLGLLALAGVNVLLFAALVGRAGQTSYVWVTPAVFAAVVLVSPSARFRAVPA